MAGIPTVTNDLDGIRRAWVPGLRVAGASAQALAHPCTKPAQMLRLSPHTTRMRSRRSLGGDLAAAVRNALANSR